MYNAEERFIEFAMETADINREEAIIVLRVYRKAKVVKIDPVMGQFQLQHGAFAEPEPIRKALELGRKG
jgi:hypothetical protein